MSQLSYLLQLNIADGKLDEFKTMADGYIAATRDKEPTTLTYQWYVSEDGKTALIHEAFTDSAALLAHLGNVGPTLPALLAIAPITRFEVMGTASDAARAALADLGAVHHPHHNGFQR